MAISMTGSEILIAAGALVAGALFGRRLKPPLGYAAEAAWFGEWARSRSRTLQPSLIDEG